LDIYVGEFNSTWVGVLVAGSTTVLLCFANFFIVKNAIAHDRHTGVGELIASTPMGKFTYLLGKVLSNFAVLMAIEGVLFVSALLIQLIHGDPQLNFLDLLLPFMFIAVPAMAAISALTLLFETLPGLRKGFGNLIFVLLWFIMVFRIAAYEEVWFDLPGLLYIDAVFTEAAQTMSIPFEGGFSIEGGALADPFAQYLRWENVTWINDMAGWRFYWFGIAICLTLVAVLSFDRFSSRLALSQRLPLLRRRISQEDLNKPEVGGDHANVKKILDRQLLTKPKLPLVATLSGCKSFFRMLQIELRLILKRPWWWYLITLCLFFMSLLVPVYDAQTFWVPLIWLWLALVLSGIGIRDSRYRTKQIVFSAPYPLRYHFFATWLAGVFVTILLGIAGARLFLIGDINAGIAWVIAAIFIPSFAFTTGILCKNRRFFECIYIAWWLIGPMASKGTNLDFIGVHPEVVARGVHWYYLNASFALLIIALLGRRRQLRAL
jgi:hypothetical protein